MDRYAKENALHKIDGYYLPSGSTPPGEGAFDKAKAECIRNLEKELANVQGITWEQFKAAKASHQL